MAAVDIFGRISDQYGWSKKTKQTTCTDTGKLLKKRHIWGSSIRQKKKKKRAAWFYTVIKASEPSSSPEKVEIKNSRRKCIKRSRNTVQNESQYLCYKSAYVQNGGLIEHLRCPPWANTSPITPNHSFMNQIHLSTVPMTTTRRKKKEKKTALKIKKRKRKERKCASKGYEGNRIRFSKYNSICNFTSTSYNL